MAVFGHKTETWGSRFGFLMAAVGSSVGLGNLWRFPYTAGENGGSAFILIYLGCVILFGLPVLMGEYAVGRKGGLSAIQGVRKIAQDEGKSPLWVAMPWIGLIASLSIFSFYVVIAAWVFEYIPQAFSGKFIALSADAELIRASVGAPIADIAGKISSTQITESCNFVKDGIIGLVDVPQADGTMLTRAVEQGDLSNCNLANTTGNKTRVLMFLAGFMALNVFIVARGVKKGIEVASMILMPLFFIMLLGLVVYGLIAGDAAAAAKFLLSPDFSKVNSQVILKAVGQAFFSIGVGSVLMLTYGAYLSRDTKIPNSSMLVAGADTLVALIAGFAIFPIVFAFGLSASAGTGLFFQTMPVAFGQMPGGSIIGGLFFILALFAAFTSSISLFEVGASLLEDWKAISRAHGTILMGIALFLIAIAYVYNGALIDVVNYWAGDVLLPLGGVLISLFVGWSLSRDSLAEELGNGFALRFVRTLTRYVVPPALITILVINLYGHFTA